MAKIDRRNITLIPLVVNQSWMDDCSGDALHVVIGAEGGRNYKYGEVYPHKGVDMVSSGENQIVVTPGWWIFSKIYSEEGDIGSIGIINPCNVAMEHVVLANENHTLILIHNDSIFVNIGEWEYMKYVGTVEARLPMEVVKAGALDKEHVASGVYADGTNGIIGGIRSNIINQFTKAGR